MSVSGFFGHPEVHPLADPRELKRIVSELPQGNAFKAVDEVAGWLESLLAANDVPADRMYEALQRLEEAAQPHVRQLLRDYLNTPRLSRADEKRLWSISHGFWSLLADSYERCLRASEGKSRVADHLRPALPSICAKLFAALGSILKWEQFHYGPTADEFWLRLGKVLLFAEGAGVATKAVHLSGLAGATSPMREYQKVALFQAASMDSLLPLEIELAERLIAHFSFAFVFTREALHDSVYWVDLQVAQPPLRLARQPEQARVTQLFFKPGPGHEALDDLLRALERGDDVPPEINFGGQYYAKTLLPVLRHLVTYLAPVPPQRKHDRHRVKHRVSVIHGLDNAFAVFAGEADAQSRGLPVENWVVDNVSRGGFGAEFQNAAADWLKIGALLAIQPEGGANWLLGAVRRHRREVDGAVSVGIETLAHDLVAVELKPRSVSRYAVVTGIGALISPDGVTGEYLVVLPTASFDLRESLEYLQQGQRRLLIPLALVEQGADFELARYRLSQPA